MSASTADEHADAEVIDLEPTGHITAEPWATRGGSGSPVPEALMAVEDESQVSLGEDLSTLLRTRLTAASLLLAVAYGILLVWYAFNSTDHTLISWALLIARFALPALAVGLLFSPISLSIRSLRFVEYVLFGGMTLIVVIAQYAINLHFMQLGEYVAMVAFVKNGVMHMVVLMFLYGTFIPNRPRTVAWVVLAMALAPLFALSVLTEHPERPENARPLPLGRADRHQRPVPADRAPGWPIYGSIVLNGLRAELHVARKFGQYQLVRKLGEGGMGEVYLAEHNLLKRPCALKLIKPEAGSDPVAMARFEREVQSAARLTHPNTIEIFDYGLTGDGTFYYVMEYLQGQSLGDLVRNHGPLPAGRVIYLMRQVCAGLAEAHGLGLVHRDLKPANVFVAVRGGESDVSKVLDFGLVKLTRDPGAANLTSDMTVSGTPMFMAPEQTIGDRSLGRPGRHLRPGRRDVPRAHRPAPVHGRERVRHHDGPLARPGRAPLGSSIPACPRISSRWSCAAWPRSPRIAIPVPRRWARPWRPARPRRNGAPTGPRPGGPPRASYPAGRCPLRAGTACRIT